MLWLVGEPSFSRLLTVELWLSFLYGSYKWRHGRVLDGDHADRRLELLVSRSPIVLPLMPSLGGFTPAISTYLIHLTGNRAIPGLWSVLCGRVVDL